MIRITNFTPNYALTNNRNPNIKFTGDNDEEIYDREGAKRISQISHMNGFLVGLCISALFGLFVNHTNTTKSKEYLDNVNELYNSDEIKKDTFTVKDVNEDDKPDIILYKKDGTRVVLDFYNNKILQEKNATVLEVVG